MKDEATLQFSRIVSMAWVSGDPDLTAAVRIKNPLVQPSDFQIADKATRHHHISQDMAVSFGRPLEDVLREFMADVSVMCENGGRVVAHQLDLRALNKTERIRLAYLLSP